MSNPLSTNTDEPRKPTPQSAATEQLWKTYQTINEWIRFADAKAAALLTVNGVILSASINAAKDNRTYLNDHRWIVALAGFGVMASVIAGFYCLDCILPKTKAGGPLSLIFFEDIADPDREAQSRGRSASAKKTPEQQAAAYREKALQLGDEQTAFDEISHQVWAVSKVAHKKHRQIACAVWALGIAFLFALICAVAVLLWP